MLLYKVMLIPKPCTSYGNLISAKSFRANACLISTSPFCFFFCAHVFIIEVLSHHICVIIDHLSLVIRKPAFCICENKDADLISAFVFATRIVQSLVFLNQKFQAPSHPVWLHSLVCVGPGRKPEDRFSHNEAHFTAVVLN